MSLESAILSALQTIKKKLGIGVAQETTLQNIDTTLTTISEIDFATERTVAGLNELCLDDTSTANVTYVGIAVIGSATSAAVWRIKKIDETTGLVITWADSNSNFDNIWDNRTSLVYG
jgi:hypothetical protein